MASAPSVPPPPPPPIPGPGGQPPVGLGGPPPIPPQTGPASSAPPPGPSPVVPATPAVSPNAVPVTRHEAKEKEDADHPPLPPVKLDPLAGVLSYLIPGLGQVYQGRIGKGLLFFFGLYALFFYGMAMGKWQNVWLPDASDLPAMEVAN